MGILDELNEGLEELRKANLPEYAGRLRSLEIKIGDLEYRLEPLLKIIKPKGAE
jgi:hypothetical protein